MPKSTLEDGMPQWSQPRFGWITPLIFTQRGPVPLPQWSRPRISRMTSQRLYMEQRGP